MECCYLGIVAPLYSVGIERSLSNAQHCLVHGGNQHNTPSEEYIRDVGGYGGTTQSNTPHWEDYLLNIYVHEGSFQGDILQSQRVCKGGFLDQGNRHTYLGVFMLDPNSNSRKVWKKSDYGSFLGFY